MTGVGVITVMQAVTEQSSFDQLRFVYTLANIVVALLAAVIFSYLICAYMKHRFNETMLQSFYDLLGEKVIVTKTSGPEVTGEFRSTGGEEGLCCSDDWIYPGMSARITNYIDGLYRVRPLYVDYRDLSAKENMAEKDIAAKQS
ncbi:MAG: hypothetical protein GX834_03640 [Clostridiaceae bacterium]|nr:hypothetical protein [Clostridiaceae bacterium]HZW97726.1 hypothetical protein [Bacillota bacterium]